MVPKFRFCLLQEKYAQIVFSNNKNIDVKQFPNLKQLFQYDESITKNNEEIIGNIKYTKFNNYEYLSGYVNKYYNNSNSRSIRFNYAYINFKNINYFSNLYYIQLCMALEQSKFTIQIEKQLLQKIYDDLPIDNCIKLFQQKIMNIGMIGIFQVKPINIQQNDKELELSFTSQDSKIEAVDYGQRQMLYEVDGKCYTQQMHRQLKFTPSRIIGEVYPL